jgi:hypothetical protein
MTKNQDRIDLSRAKKRGYIVQHKDVEESLAMFIDGGGKAFSAWTSEVSEAAIFPTKGIAEKVRKKQRNPAFLRVGCIYETDTHWLLTFRLQ